MRPARQIPEQGAGARLGYVLARRRVNVPWAMLRGGALHEDSATAVA
ncbi:MAG: hypothetical protein M3Q49_07230 [Actinomycetota bacterium]|nr:hypothetical protein [Actinomycetota bacterium]